MSRTQFEDELVFRSKVDFLQMLAAREVPEMQATAISGAQQDLRNQPILEGIWRTPFARHEGVVAEMPPAIVGELLWAALNFPPPKRLETLLIQQKDPTRRATVGAAESRHVDAAGAAMHGVRARVAGPARYGLRFNGLDYDGFERIGLGIKNIDARRSQPRNHQIAALCVGVWCIWAQARGAGIPAEVMQFVTGMWHRHIAHDAGISR